MEGRGPTSQGSRSGGGLDVLVWAVTIAGMIGVAAAVAWVLSNSSFRLREITVSDETAEYDLIPVAPAAEEAPPAEAPLADAAAAPDGGATRPVSWVRQPAPDFAFPAAERGIVQGDVVLLCAALASGRLGACQVVEENPPGMGFGEAALDSAAEARVSPRLVDGVPVDGSVRFTIRFRLAP